MFITLANTLMGYSSWANNPFKTSLPISKSYSTKFEAENNIKVFPITSDKSIYGLSIDATITQYGEESLVRILLEDKEGNEYLILQASPLLTGDEKKLYVYNYCEETHLLEGISPTNIIIAAKEASVELSSIHVSYDENELYEIAKKDSEKTRKEQIVQIADIINNYTRKHHLLWRANVTELAKKSYHDRKIIMGYDSDTCNLYGLEFYANGIFLMGTPSSITDPSESQNSPYVKSFRWDNRHGINWLTPFRNQGNSGFCYGFAPVATLESYVNLYYNQKIDVDLSEEQAAVLTYSPSMRKYHYQHGGNDIQVSNYIVNTGIVNEEAFPFVDDSLYVDPALNIDTAAEWVKPQRFKTISSTYSDTIKKYLIHKGPLTMAHRRGNGGHSMSLIGYRVAQAGDTVALYANGFYEGTAYLEEGGLWSQFIGHTLWIFKNSYGPTSSYYNDGYYYMILPSRGSIHTPSYFEGSLQTKNYNNTDIRLTDNDGDGYYYWGIGPKPAFYNWISDEPDGDDSDFTKGPMNEYGYLMDNCPDSLETIYINEDTSYSGFNSFHNHMVVQNSATLVLNGTATFYPSVKITIKSGSTLWIDGCSLDNASFDIKPGAKVKMSNNTYTRLLQNKNFVIPLGAELELIEGVIE